MVKAQKKQALPEAGYSIREVEEILGIAEKTGYRLVKDGKLESFKDSVGAMKVSPNEVYAYQKIQK